MIVFYQRLTKADANKLLKEIRTFLTDHPRRRVIRVEVGPGRVLKIRRGHEVEAIKEIAVEGWTHV